MTRSAMNRKLLGYIGKRAIKHYSTIWLIAVVTFFLIHSAPPLDYGGCGRGPSPEEQKQQIKKYDLDQPLVQRFFSYMLIDVEAGQRTGLGWLDLGLFSVYQIGPESGSTLECGAVCVNLGPSYRQRGKDVEDILFGPRP